jgi:hypothetical protein
MRNTFTCQPPRRAAAVAAAAERRTPRIPLFIVEQRRRAIVAFLYARCFTRAAAPQRAS